MRGQFPSPNSQSLILRRKKSLYFIRNGRVLSAHRELRLPDRLLRRGTRDYGHPLPERGRTPRCRCAGPAGASRPQRSHSVRRPRGHRRQPDRLLGGLPGGTAVRLEVGEPREAHSGTPGVGGTSLRAPRRQGRLRRPLLLGLAHARSAGGWHEPYALGHVRLVQRPRRGGVGHGGRYGGVFLRPELGCDATLVGTLTVAAGPSAPGGARHLLHLPVGDLPPESIGRAASGAFPSGGPASVSLFIASTVSGIETTLDCAPCAPASTAWAATVWSRFAVNTSVGRTAPSWI